MARIRTIKPEFFTSEDIVLLSPLARLLYIALWCEADKEGRLVWKPLTFKLRYLPADECDIKALCKEIVDRGLVTLYGEGYAVIPAFGAHQHINPRESSSQLPEPVANTTREARVGTRHSRVSTGANLDMHAQVGREGKGKEGIDDASAKPARGASAKASPHGFDEFWQAYPKKVGIDDARKAFAKRKPDDALLAAMLAAVSAQRESQAWIKDGGQFIPNPATWLTQGRWQDELPGNAMTSREQSSLGMFV